MKTKSFPKEIWLILIIVFLATMVQIFGSQKALDVRLYYTAAEAKAFFDGLSTAEVAAYIRHELFDLAFIFTYSYLLFLQLRRFYKPSLAVTILAVLPGVFDFIETTTILLVLMGWFESPSWLGATTLIKWVTAALSILAVLVGWIRKRF